MSSSTLPTDQKTKTVNEVSPAPREVPGPKGLELWGSLFRFRRDAIAAFEHYLPRWGDAIAFPTGRLHLLLLNRPEHVAHVLLTNAKGYRKSISYREMELALGKGLLTSEGSFWKRQRRLAQPTFQRKNLVKFGPLVTRRTAEMLDGWRERAEPFDLHHEMVHLTLRIVGHALFSLDLSDKTEGVSRGLGIALPFIQHRMEALFNWPMWLPLPSHLRFKRTLRELDAEVEALIAEREQLGPEEAPRDLLSGLVFARDPDTGERMNPRQVRDEVVTFLLAGHETTANALAWTFHRLAAEPEVLRRLVAEVDAVLGGRPPTFADLPQLEYTRRVLLESMRLDPPAWIVEREAIEDDVVGGYRIPKDSVVMLCSATVHRHPEFWEEPDRFDPDRFLPERVAARPRAAYFPFGLGQRQCIGEGFAMFEMQMVLAMVAQAFELTPVPGRAVEREVGITLRPRTGIWMHAKRRETHDA